MKQIASHLEEDITAKRQNIVHINTIISNKAAANTLRSYLKETDMETNFEMFDVARLAESLPHFYVDARTKNGDLFKTTTQKKKFEEIYNENRRIIKLLNNIYMDPSTPTDLANRVRINVRLFLSKSQYKYGIYYKRHVCHWNIMS